jgi:thiol-disulfide isomerase/thioredoxin
MPLVKVNSYIKGGHMEEKVNNGKAIIVYHWNNCGHCRAFMPILHQLLEQDRNLRDRSNLFEIEYSNFGFVPKPFTNVSAFPYIVAYENGQKREEFEDQRTPEKLRSFITRNSSHMTPKKTATTPKKPTPKKPTPKKPTTPKKQTTPKKRLLKSY